MKKKIWREYFVSHGSYVQATENNFALLKKKKNEKRIVQEKLPANISYEHTYK